MDARRRSLAGRLGTLAGVFLLIALIAPPAMVVLYRFVPPPVTVLMIERLLQGQGVDRRWIPLGAMPPAMVRSVIAAEDARFCAHHGFDLVAIDRAMAHNQARPRTIRGGSTISQQTAKNVFLWPQRSWLRKGLEAWFTVLIETIWGKRRIMEVYLNTVEMGPGVYGVEAAARRDFRRPARDLETAQAARLAAILPSPLKWRAIDPGPYVRARSASIGARSKTVLHGGLADCVLGPTPG